MKRRLSLLALTAALLASITALAQDQPLSLQERCAALKAQAPNDEATPRLCLAVKSHRLSETDALIELLVPGEIRNDFSVEVIPLRLTEANSGQWSQTEAGNRATLKVSPSPRLPPQSNIPVRTLVEAKTDPEANAVSIHWRFGHGIYVDGKRIEFDTTVIMKLSDEPEWNVVTITPAK